MTELLTVDQARRAIYIDLEGPAPSTFTPDQEREPALMGVLVEDSWEQVIVDPVLFGIAYYEGKLGFACSATEFASLHLELVERCLVEDRSLVAFGEHEYEMFCLFGDRTLEPQTDAVYVDAEPTLKAGWNPLSTIDHKLDFYRGRYGLDPLPKYLAGHKTGPRIAKVKASVSAPSNGGDFGPRARSARGHWTKARQRNERDCWDLKAMTIEAARRMP